MCYVLKNRLTDEKEEIFKLVQLPISEPLQHKQTKVVSLINSQYFNI